MFNNLNQRVKLGIVVTLLGSALVVVGGQTRKSEATPASAAEAALPTPDELPGFGHYNMRTRAKGSKQVRAQRASDAAKIRITVHTAANAKEAHEYAVMTMSNNSNGLLPGAPSGRKVGEECWRSRYQPGTPPTGGFQVIARDGRSLVNASITLQVDTSESGAAIQRPLKAQDLQFVEQQVVNCLNKLTEMGYTSQSKK